MESAAIITAAYAVCNSVRLLFYVPQMMAIARDRSGAHAISLATWMFWSLSHAVTAIYCYTVVNDALLGNMMWGNALGCVTIVSLTKMQRLRQRRDSSRAAA